MTCSSSKSNPSGKTPTDILTYRYDGELMYVPVAPDYNALSHAREAFPQLRKLSNMSLSLSLTAPGHEQKFVGISAPAWPKLITHMTRYQILDVHVTQTRNTDVPIHIPRITITYADADSNSERMEMEPVPPYSVPDCVDDEKAGYGRPPSPSPSRLTLQAGKRNWLFHKLHGQRSMECIESI